MTRRILSVAAALTILGGAAVTTVGAVASPGHGREVAGSIVVPIVGPVDPTAPDCVTVYMSSGARYICVG